MECKCGKEVWYDGKCKKCFEESRKLENIAYKITELIKDYEDDVSIRNDTGLYTREYIIQQLKSILGGI